MTHLVFLPHDGAVIVNEVDEGAESLAARITAGEWQPPHPYQNMKLRKGGLRALTWGSLVVVMQVDHLSIPTQSHILLPAGFSELEQKILQYAVDGLSNKEIAQQLKLSLRSISRHIERIKTRLGVETRAESMTRAIQLGLIRMKKN